MEYRPHLVDSAQREIEMKNRQVLDTELNSATDSEKSRYYKLLNAARRNRMSKEKPGPVTISIEERLNLVQKAKSGEDIEVLAKPQEDIKVDPITMERDWESATLRGGGRPPIGGSQD